MERYPAADLAKLKRKRHKYGVAPKEERTVDGIVFHSKKEAKRYVELKLLNEAGNITHLTRQMTFNLGCPYCGGTLEKYVADYFYWDKSGAWVIEEVKGKWTEEAKRKWKKLQKQYGDRYQYRVI